jgi:hypothetical protein
MLSCWFMLVATGNHMRLSHRPTNGAGTRKGRGQRRAARQGCCACEAALAANVTTFVLPQLVSAEISSRILKEARAQQLELDAEEDDDQQEGAVSGRVDSVLQLPPTLARCCNHLLS